MTGNSAGDYILTSLRCLATAWTMAAAGVWLARQGILTPPVRKCLSQAVLNVLLPALLFTSVLSGDDCPSVTDNLSTGFPLLAMPPVLVLAGSLLGTLVVRITRPPKDFERATLAACSFGNSTAMPITILSTLRFSAKTDLGAYDPVTYMAIYLISAPVFAWSIGSTLMGVGSKRGGGDPQQQQQPSDLSHLPPDEVASLTASSLDECAFDVSDSDEEGEYAFGINYSDPLLGDERDTLAQNPPKPWYHHHVHVAKRALTPPVRAIVVALAIGVVPALWRVVVDTEDRDDDAPLEPFFDGLVTLGEAAVPVQMLVLGGSMASGANWDAVSLKTALAIAVVKMLVMPCVGIVAAYVIQAMVLDGSPSAASVTLVAMVISSTPTANSTLVQAECAGQNREALATCILVQYLLTPLFMVATLSVFVSLATDWQIDDTA